MDDARPSADAAAALLPLLSARDGSDDGGDDGGEGVGDEPPSPAAAAARVAYGADEAEDSADGPASAGLSSAMCAPSRQRRKRDQSVVPRVHFDTGWEVGATGAGAPAWQPKQQQRLGSGRWRALPPLLGRAEQVYPLTVAGVPPWRMPHRCGRDGAEWMRKRWRSHTGVEESKP